MISRINENIQKSINVVKKQLKHGIILQEPDYTAALAIGFPQLMNASSNNSNITFGGCFIHQSPKVKFNTADSCELGDLLVLVRKKTKEGDRINTALLQFKMSDKSPERLKNEGDMRQLSLYEKWPEFEIVKTKKKYNIFPKVVNQGALYCMINRSKPQFYMAEPMEDMSYSKATTFGRFLFNMINWQAGRSISDNSNNAGADEWSKLIWDLIESSSKTIFNRKNICYCNKTRLCDNFFRFMIEFSMDPIIAVCRLGNDYYEDIYENDYEEDGSGISILFIDVDDREK